MQNENLHLEILVVEDNLGDYILIEDYLSEFQPQLSVLRASTFTEARDLLTSQNSFDAVLLDLSLPDSYDREKLVNDVIDLAGKSPVIVLTGNSNKDFGVKTLSMGISDYLLKDELNPQQLSKSIFYSIERKRTQQELSESEKKYRALFNLSPLPMFVLERQNLNFLNVNEAALDLYGYTREEFLKLTVRDLWAKSKEPEIEEIVSKQRHDYFKIKISHKKKNGEILHLEVQSNPMVFDGKDARVSLVNDVTAKLKAENLLAKSEQRFKALVQEASDMVMILNFCGKIDYISPSSEIVVSFSADNSIANNFFDLIHPEEVEAVRKYIAKLKNRKRIQLPSYRIKSSKNEWRWIETILTNLIEDPAVNGIVANLRDITEFVMQEKQLKESLQRYVIVAKATSDTITDYDIVNDKLVYNEGMQTMFGYDPLDVLNNRDWWDEKLHPDDRERVRAKTREVYKHGNTILQIEYRFRCADGAYKYILDRSFLVKDEEGKPVRMIGSMQNITEVHNYIETIEKNNSRLKDIAWTQSHVVRAPLARIMGLIDLMQNHNDIENKNELLDHILDSAKELDGIIRKISTQTELVSPTSR